VPGTAAKLWRSLNWPNRISILRLLLIAPFVVLIMNQNKPGWPYARYAAVALYIGMAVSDLLDGLLARRLHARTRLGAILDPLADKALVIFAVVLLSIPEFRVPGHRLDNWVVVAAVGKDLWIIVGFLVIYLVTDKFLVRATLPGKAATAAMGVMVPSVLLAPELNAVLPKLGTYLMLVLETIVTVLCVATVLSYTGVGLMFVIQQEKPLDNHHERKADHRDAD
jgi:cardiolipin synthase